MKKFDRIICASLCALLCAALPSAALAAGTLPVTKDESVYCVLNPDGSLKEQTVSCWLHSDSGLSGVCDQSTLANITNVKSDTKPEVSGTSVKWNTDETDIYYTGTSDKTPPVSVLITYQLDGKDISAQDLIGKSGKVKINIHLTNNQSEQKEIGGRMRTVYTPYAAAVVMNLPVNNFKDVAAGNSQIITESTNQVVSFISLPGLKENFSGILEDELSGVMDKVSDDFTVTAHTSGFTMPTIAMAATTNLADLKDISLDGKVTEVTDGIDELKSAAEQLKEGTDLLSQAVGEFDSKMTELESNYNAFNDGLNKAVAGAGALKSGTAQLNSAAAALKDKVTGQLIPGINGSAALENQLKQKMEVLKTQLAGLQIPDMAALQAQLSAAVGSVCDSSSDATIQILTGGGTLAGLPAAQQDAINSARASIKAAAGSQIGAAFSSIDLSALNALSASLTEISTLSDQLMGSMDLLTSSLYNPNDSDLTNPQTLSNAIIALSTGAADIDSGAGDLNSGVNDLAGASGQIRDAISRFKSGTETLTEKTGELDNGMGEFKEEGVSRLSDSDITGDLETALAIKNAMQEQADAISSYSGSPEGIKNTVRFIMKTDGIETEKKADNTAAAQDQPQENLWDKIAGFFKGLFS